VGHVLGFSKNNADAATVITLELAAVEAFQLARICLLSSLLSGGSGSIIITLV